MERSIANTLHDDHQATLSLLERMETTLRRLGAGNVPSAEDAVIRNFLTDMISTLEAEVKGHFAFEEEHLFPRFSENIDPGIPMMLKQEHDIIRPLSESLIANARVALAEGFNAESWAAFYDEGLELVEREVFHIQKEEMGFLPELDYLIDASEGPELAMAYAGFKEAS